MAVLPDALRLTENIPLILVQINTKDFFWGPNPTSTKLLRHSGYIFNEYKGMSSVIKDFFGGSKPPFQEGLLSNKSMFSVNLRAPNTNGSVIGCP